MGKVETQEFWDEHHDEWVGGPPDAYWTSNPLLNAYVNLQIAGGMERSTLSWLKEDVFQDMTPLPYIASIACGAGVAERQALDAGLCEYVDGFDFSEASLATARLGAEAAGLADRVTYRKYDFNVESVPADGRKYPLIIIFGGLHHAKNLEFVLAEIGAILAPGGIVFFNEYIGPNRFQYEPDHVELLNSVLASLPPEFRHSDQFVPIDGLAVAEADPSEAVRSGEIMDKVAEEFHILDRRDYGGAIFYPLWATMLVREKLILYRHVMESRVLQELVVLEEELTKSGKLPSLFTQCLVCRKEDVANLAFVPERLEHDRRVARPSELLLSSNLADLDWPQPTLQSELPDPGPVYGAGRLRVAARAARSLYQAAASRLLSRR